MFSPSFQGNVFLEEPYFEYKEVNYPQYVAYSDRSAVTALTLEELKSKVRVTNLYLVILTFC